MIYQVTGFNIPGGMVSIASFTLLFLFLGFMLLTIFYFFAIAFGLEKLKSKIKGEFLEVLVSVLFLIFFMGIFTILDQAASQVSSYVAQINYGITDPQNQKLYFYIDIAERLRAPLVMDFGGPDGQVLTQLFNRWSIPAVLTPARGIMYLLGVLTYSGRASVIANPEYIKLLRQAHKNQEYLVMEIDPRNYVMFAEGLMRKSIFCTYNIWSAGRRILVPLTILRSFSTEAGGFDPSTAAALQIPIDIIKKLNNPTLTIATFQYVFIHLIRIFTAYFPLFVGIGIILRAFKPLRSIGGFVLAFAIVMRVFFPLGIVVFMGNTESYAYNCYVLETPVIKIANPLDPSFFHIVKNYWSTEKESMTTSIKRMYEFVIRLWNETLTGMFALLVGAFTLIRALSGIFGADVAEIGRGLVKFV